MAMNQSNRDKATSDSFANDVAEELRASEDKLDMATLSRLNQARQRALEQTKETSRFGLVGWLGFAGGVFACLLIVTLFVGSPVTQDGALLEEQDLSIALENNWELYNDLEFYEWLAEVEHG
jgi:Protein of unknown function (DUF3619)